MLDFNEKKTQFSDSKKLTLVLRWILGCSIALIFLGVIFLTLLYSNYEKFDDWPYKFLSVMHIVLVVYAVGSFIWCIATLIFLRKKNFDESRFTKEDINTFLAKFLFILGSVLTVLFFAVFIVLVYWREDFIKNIPLMTNEVNFHLKNYGVFVMFVGSIVTVIVLGVNTLNFSDICRSRASYRALLYMSGFGLTVAFFLLIFNGNYINELVSKTVGVEEVIHDVHFVKGCLVIAVMILAITMVGYFFSFRKWSVGMFIVGSSLLIPIFVGISYGVLVYTDAHKVHVNMKEFCPEKLKLFKDSYLASLGGCSNKYLTATSHPYLGCSVREQSVEWEREETEVNINKVNKRSCLNLGCCETLKQIYEKWLLSFFITNLIGLSLTFLYVLSSYELSQQLDTDEGYGREDLSFVQQLMAITFIILTFLVFIVLYFAVLSYEMPAQGVNIITYKSERGKRIAIADIKKISGYRPEEDILRPECFRLENYLTQNYNPKLLIGTCLSALGPAGQANLAPINSSAFLTCQDHIRSAFIAKNGRFYYSSKFNSPKIKLLDERAREILFLDYKKFPIEDSDFIGFQGLPVDLVEFFKINLRICPNNLLEPVEISYIQAQTDPVYSNPSVDSGMPAISNTPTKASNKNSFGLPMQAQEVPEVKNHRKKNDGTKQWLLPAFIEVKPASGINRILTAKKNSQGLIPVVNVETKEITDINVTKKLNETIFKDYTLHVIDSSSGQGIPGATVKIYEENLLCKKDQLEEAKIVFISVSNKTGSITIHNLENKRYSVFVEAEEYNVNCYWFEVETKEKNEQWTFLTKRLNTSQIRVMIDWKKPDLEFNLFGQFNFDNTSQCLAGAINQFCGGFSFSQLNPSENSRMQALTLEPIGDYQYLFFVKELISNKTQAERKKNGFKLNHFLINSELQISLYIGELRYPVFIRHRVPVPRNENLDIVKKEEHLAYLMFCIDARSTLWTERVDKFWISKIDDFKKRKGQEFPNSDFCKNYANFS